MGIRYEMSRVHSRMHRLGITCEICFRPDLRLSLTFIIISGLESTIALTAKRYLVAWASW